MRVIKHQDLREFMLGLAHEGYENTLEILVKYYNTYTYSAHIIYDCYSRCWRCIASQTEGGSICSTAFDHRVVRAKVAHMPAWNTSITRYTTTTDGNEPFDAQVTTWLSGSTGA